MDELLDLISSGKVDPGEIKESADRLARIFVVLLDDPHYKVSC